MVTCRAKRRKLGDRVVRQFSPEIKRTGVPTLLTVRKAKRAEIVMVRFCPAPRGWKSAMSYNDAASTGKSL